MSEQKFEYSYPKEELLKLLQQRMQGIDFPSTEELEQNLKLLQLELQQEEDDDVDDVIIEKQKNKLLHVIEKKKREATKKDVVIIKLTDDQKQKLKDDMTTSIVRKNPNLAYHKSDDEVFEDNEKRILHQKLSRLKNCYYNAMEWKAAMHVIMEAIKYSLQHDYPWLTYKEALESFNKGEIKFTFCKIPHLFVNWSTEITDRAILSGILTGEVELKAREEKPVKKPKREYKPIEYEYQVVGDTDYSKMMKLHQQGYDTVISPMIKAKFGTVNRFALPSNNRFFVDRKNDEKHITSFDWTKPGAGEEYYNITHDKHYTTTNLINDINAMNNGELNHIMNSSISEFLRSMKELHNGKTEYHLERNNTGMIQINEKAAQKEAAILQAMRLNNPNQ